MSKKIFIFIASIIVFIVALPLAACSQSTAPDTPTASTPDKHTTSAPDSTQTSTQPAEPVCALTEERVGENVRVTGTLGFIDRNNPEGKFADLGEGRCHAGIWISLEQWESWTGEEQALLTSGTTVVASGQLNSFEDELVVELSSPLSPAGETSPAAVQDIPREVSTSSLAKLDLVAKPAVKKRLGVEKVYSGGEGPGLCYLGSYAMLAHFADNDIDFSDVIASSGIATSAVYIPEINLMVNGFEIGSIAIAAENQGFDYYIAAQEGAGLTDQFFATNLVENAEQIISVKGEDEAFDLLERLISSDIPVMTHLDINFMKDALIEYCPYWKTIFDWQEANLGSTHVDHYMSVNGYDENYIYLNDPTEKQENKGEDIPIEIGDFLDAWKNGNHTSFAEESHIGPYWMLFLGERVTPKSADELISWNSEIASRAIPAIRQASDSPNVSELIQCNGMYRSRREFAAFLKENGYAEAGDIYSEISTLFGGLCRSANQQSDLRRIADLQEQSLTMW